MDRDEKLSEWIDSLSEEKAKDILFQLIDRMIETDEIRFHPEEGKNIAPHWEVNGERLDEDEE